MNVGSSLPAGSPFASLHLTHPPSKGIAERGLLLVRQIGKRDRARLILLSLFDHRSRIPRRSSPDIKSHRTMGFLVEDGRTIQGVPPLVFSIQDVSEYERCAADEYHTYDDRDPCRAVVNRFFRSKFRVKKVVYWSVERRVDCRPRGLAYVNTTGDGRRGRREISKPRGRLPACYRQCLRYDPAMLSRSDVH